MVLTVEDGGVFGEVTQREVEVGGFVAIKTTIDAVAFRDVEGTFGVGDVAIVCAFFHPHFDAVSFGEGRGQLEFVGGIFP